MLLFANNRTFYLSRETKRETRGIEKLSGIYRIKFRNWVNTTCVEFRNTCRHYEERIEYAF